MRPATTNRPGAAILALACVAALLGADAARAESKAPPEHGLAYEEVLTAGATAAEPLPLVIAIHGLGDRPDRFAGLLRTLPVKARVIVPRAPTPWGDGGSWFTPKHTAAARRELETSAAKIVALARAVAAEKPTRGRPMVTGFSQGGILSFVLAVRHPDTFAAAFPVGGALPRPLAPSRGPKSGGGREGEGPTIRAFHGAADRRLPVGPTEAAVARLKAQGWDVALRTYEGVGHRIPPKMRADLHAAIAAALPTK